MDSADSSKDEFNAAAPGNGRAHLQAQMPERGMAAFDRLSQATATELENLDRLAQSFAVVLSETLGDLCSIQVLNQDNELIHLAGLHDPDPRALSLLQDAVVAMAEMPRDTGAAGRVIENGEPLLMASVPEDALRAVLVPEFLRYVDEVGMATAMAVPLNGRSGRIGVITMSRHRGRPDYTSQDLALLERLSVPVSTAIDNLLLLRALRTQLASTSLTAHEALTASEERFRSVFESTTLGIELLDLEGTILDANRALERMTGFTRLDLIGRSFGTLQHPEDVRVMLQLLTETRMGHEPSGPFENRIVRRDGSTLWVRTNMTAVSESASNRNLAFIAVVYEDITGRKQAEQYFKAVLDATPDALVIVDAAGRIVLVNRQMETMFGYTRVEVIGQSVEMLLPERLQGKHPLHRAGYLRDPHVRPMGAGLELFAARRDGSEFPVEISLSPLVSDQVLVVAAVRDISERKQREAALVRSERSLAEAQQVAHLGNLDYDIARGTVEASDEALRILGIPRENFRGPESIRAAMHREDEMKVVNATNAAVENHAAGEIEFRAVHPDGTQRIVHDRVIGVYDADGKPLRIIGTIQDVTEQRQAEKEVTELRNHLQSSVELERLRLAQELHDGAMQELYGATYHIDELLDSADPAMREALEQVSKEIEGTISELRTIAKELRPPAISNFGLEKAIRSYVEDFHEKHPTINLHLSLAQDRQLLPENMRLTLFRVFQQALTNVLRHSQASEVKVRFSLDAQEARLEVTDNGTGFRVPSNWISLVRHGHYGLAGSAERVNALGGILLVESEPQRATTITAIIPWTPGQSRESVSENQ